MSKKKTPEKVSPPELLCDINVEDRPKVCSMLDSMMAKRKNLLLDTNWTLEKCTENFKYVQKKYNGNDFI